MPTPTSTPTPVRSLTATPTATPPRSSAFVRWSNDPLFQAGRQYGLHQIRALDGWGYSTGSESIIIAIVDTGIDLAHPDLADKIIPGYDFVNNDPIPQDDHGHGTHVAGIAAAVTNNGIGIAGVSWGARLLPVKVLNEQGWGYTSAIAAGIVWAADRGARVINLSLGGPASTTLREAVNYAVGKGALVVAAAGNSGNSTPNYPGAYPAAISVAATDSTNRRASFSNFGPFVDLAAPGVSIYSTVPTGSCDLCHPSGYRALSGTSMATPMVAGVLAILAGLAPEASPAGLRAAVEQSALDLGPAGRDDEYGFGLVQLDAAIRTLRPDLAPAPTATPSPTPTVSSPTPTAPPVLRAPSFTRLSPSQGFTSQPQELLIEGANFLRATTASLRHTKSGAEVGLANVRILDSTWLLGTVPAGIASGSYDLLLVNPPAAETVVREAYLVRDPPGSPAAGGGQTIVIPVAAQRTTLDP
jgi:subtilisin family serine protease